MLSDTQPTQLVHPEIQSGHSFTNVLLVDSIVKDFTVFVDSVNSSTFPIVYSSNSSKSELLALLQTHFVAINRIGLCFVSQAGDATELFLDNTPFSFSENKDYLVNIINTFQVKNMDFLACDTLHSPVWNDYYTQLTQSTSVIIGASDDKTGNIKYGGDWIMESTSEDLESIYFNQNIGYYNYLLDITMTSKTFAALKTDGSVVAWGDASLGGTAPSEVTSAGSNVIHIYSNMFAFAALKSDGSVVVWGDGNFGGSLTSPVDVASQLGAGSNVIKIFPSSPYSRSDVNPLPVVGNTITVPTTGPALRLTSGLAVQNRAARKAFVQELITNNSIALATTGVKMVVDAAAFLNSSIRSTITKSKVNLVTSSTLSGGEFDTTTSLAPDEALYAPLEKIGDFIVIKLLSGNKIKFEKSSFTEYNVYEDSDNNTTPTATLLEGVARIYENFNYVTGSVTGQIILGVSVKLGWNLIGATKTGDVFDYSNIINTMSTYNTDSKSYVSVDLINGKRSVTKGNGYFVDCSQNGSLDFYYD